MPRSTLELTRVNDDFDYRALTFSSWPSQTIHLPTLHPMSRPEPHQKVVWAAPLSLAATYGIDFLSFPLGTKMFQFPRCTFSSSYWFLLG